MRLLVDRLADELYNIMYIGREMFIIIMKKEIHTNDRIKRNNMGKFLANNKS